MPVPFPPAGYSEDIVRRVRVLFNGEYVVDAQAPKLVWEHPFYPQYYFDQKDVATKYLTNPGDEGKHDLTVGSRTAPGAVTIFPSGDFKGFVRVTFSAADAWFEEDERLYVHPKDPYKRIQIFESSKHVRVEIDGVEVASTSHPKLLYETGLPVRTYIPHTDVRLELLRPSDLITSCPYKGDANYYKVNLPSGEKDGLAWWYKTPISESLEIKGLIAFYDEKVDVWVDGVKQKRSVTHFA